MRTSSLLHQLGVWDSLCIVGHRSMGEMGYSRRGSSGPKCRVKLTKTCITYFPFFKDLPVCACKTCEPLYGEPLVQPISVHTGQLLVLRNCGVTSNDKPPLIPETTVLIRTNHLGVDGTCKSRHLGNRMCESVPAGSTAVETGKGRIINEYIRIYTYTHTCNDKIYTCTCTHECAHKCTDAHLHSYTHTYIHTYTHTYTTHTYTHTYTTHTYIHTCIPTYKHTYIYIYMHTYIHTYIHVYIYLPTSTYV
jgi:hypothetical protein